MVTPNEGLVRRQRRDQLLRWKELIAAAFGAPDLRLKTVLCVALAPLLMKLNLLKVSLQGLFRLLALGCSAATLAGCWHTALASILLLPVDSLQFAAAPSAAQHILTAQTQI